MSANGDGYAQKGNPKTLDSSCNVHNQPPTDLPDVHGK